MATPASGSYLFWTGNSVHLESYITNKLNFKAFSNPINNIVKTAQGHLTGTPEITNYRLGDELGMGASPDYRRFNYEKILK